MNIAIVGSRTLRDEKFLFDWCDKLTTGIRNITVVSGCANGADKLGEKWAESRGFSVKRIPANWEKHGKPAGMIRNMQIVSASDMMIAFWDGKSKGTKGSIDAMKKSNKLLHVIKFEQVIDEEQLRFANMTGL